ncbi:MAG: DnaB-like helicase N-terminal domain-containing protein, partial [Pseudomonadota bacterium]
QTPEKITPHNLEIEAGLIGAILRYNRVFDVIDARVTVDDFYAPVHRRLYELISKIVRSLAKWPRLLRCAISSRVMLSCKGLMRLITSTRF